MNTNTRRWTALLTGLTLTTVALCLAVAGAYAAWLRSSGHYLDLGAHGTYQSRRYAITTDSIDWHSELFGWVGSARLELAPAGGSPIFVGVASPEEVDQHLAGIGYTTLSERGSELMRTDHGGSAPPASTTHAIDWTAYGQGQGTQTLTWVVKDSSQTVVAMNADGSNDVQVRVVSSAVTLSDMPWYVPTIALVVGAALGPLGVVILRRGTRPRWSTGPARASTSR